jgi:hypothetical protein
MRFGKVGHSFRSLWGKVGSGLVQVGNFFKNVSVIIYIFRKKIKKILILKNLFKIYPSLNFFSFLSPQTQCRTPPLKT